MKEDRRRITGIILAGGKSSRMGQDKGLKLLAGKPMVQYVIDQLSPHVDALLLVANSAAYRGFHIPMVQDLVAAAGPMGGIYTGLKASETAQNFVVSCDMPFICPEAIMAVLQAAEAPDAAMVRVASLHGQMQPLFGLYHKACLPLLEESLQKGNYKLQIFVRDISGKLVEMDALAAKNPQLFANINTREEFAQAECIMNK